MKVVRVHVQREWGDNVQSEREGKKSDKEIGVNRGKKSGKKIPAYNCIFIKLIGACRVR